MQSEREGEREGGEGGGLCLCGSALSLLRPVAVLLYYLKRAAPFSANTLITAAKPAAPVARGTHKIQACGSVGFPSGAAE